jgi:hypothetical protein
MFCYGCSKIWPASTTHCVAPMATEGGLSGIGSSTSCQFAEDLVTRSLTVKSSEFKLKEQCASFSPRVSETQLTTSSAFRPGECRNANGQVVSKSVSNVSRPRTIAVLKNVPNCLIITSELPAAAPLQMKWGGYRCALREHILAPKCLPASQP